MFVLYNIILKQALTEQQKNVHKDNHVVGL